jgi:FMN phosphatase YigB (HAD superfamily)
MCASAAVMICDRLSNDIRPARLLGSKTIRVAQGVRAVSVAAGFVRRSRSDWNDLAGVAPALNDKFYTR